MMFTVIKAENLSKLRCLDGAKHNSLRDTVIFRRILWRKARFFVNIRRYLFAAMRIHFNAIEAVGFDVVNSIEGDTGRLRRKNGRRNSSDS